MEGVDGVGRVKKAYVKRFRVSGPPIGQWRRVLQESTRGTCVIRRPLSRYSFLPLATAGRIFDGDPKNQSETRAVAGWLHGDVFECSH